MRAKAPWGVMVALTAPAPTWALGLGDIELFSALNQPFRAEIGLTATADELSSLRVSLADRSRFEDSGLDRPAFMSNFEFDISRNSAGENVIAIRSGQSVADPFVTMIIEATSSSGILFREYTVFLDPPVLLQRSQESAPIAAPRAGGAQSTQPAAPINRPAPSVSRAPVQPAPAPRAAEPTRGSGREDSYGPVQRSETLWAIANRYQPAGATMNQTMVAIYEANRDAFGGNINVLRVGAILRIPAGSELQALSAAAANEEVRRQNENWSQRNVTQGSRVVLVPPSPDSVQPGAGAANAPRAAAPANNQVVSNLQDEVTALRQELDESRRLLELRNTELNNLQNQLAAGAEAVTDAPGSAAAVTAPGVDIGGDQIFADETTDAAAAEAEPAETVAPTAVPPPAERPAAVVQRAPEPSLLDRVLGWLMGWGGMIVAGVAAILFAALWFMRGRREEAEDVTGHWDALEAGMDETNVPARQQEPAFAMPSSRADQAVDSGSPFLVQEQTTPSSTTLPIDDAEAIAADHFARSDGVGPSPDDTLSTSAVLNLDEADPIAEADFHMAYGLYDQAAELLTKELAEQPDRRDLRLKLLEVYFVWGNKDEFLDTATHLRELMGQTPDGDWDKVLIMGKQICPDAELFAASASGGSVDLALGDDDSGSLDFAFDDQSDDDMDLIDIGEATSTGNLEGDADAVDLDLTGSHVIDDRHSTVPHEVTGTLNIGEQTAAGLEAALFDDDAAEADAIAANDPESLVSTQETPALTDAGEPDIWSDMTIESPTVEQLGAEQPTIESPGVQQDDATLLQETALIAPDDHEALEGATTELPAIDPAAPGSDYTAELELNDLGLDVSGIDDAFGLDDIADQLDSEAGDTREQLALESSGEILSATGITQVLQEQQTTSSDVGADEQTQLQAGGTLLQNAEVDARQNAETELLQVPAEPADEFDLDLDDLSAALSDADTIEQPQADPVDLGFSGGDETPLDLDVGETFVGDDDPTNTEDIRSADPQTLTEVGTKLDLARAYIDMGDPEGARSILEEVLSEGDSTQRDEAQSLIQAIGA